jgi:hypothetical protein
VITVSSYYALNLPQRQTDRQTDTRLTHTHPFHYGGNLSTRGT